MIPRLEGPFWTWVLPVGIFVVSAWATLALYLHFARNRDVVEDAAARRPEDPGGGSAL